MGLNFYYPHMNCDIIPLETWDQLFNLHRIENNRMLNSLRI